MKKSINAQQILRGTVLTFGFYPTVANLCEVIEEETNRLGESYPKMVPYYSRFTDALSKAMYHAEEIALAAESQSEDD